MRADAHDPCGVLEQVVVVDVVAEVDVGGVPDTSTVRVIPVSLTAEPIEKYRLTED
ncbi:hypothetical protein GCM10027068_11550 [Prescottella soli]